MTVSFTNTKEFNSAILSWAEDEVPRALVKWQKRIVFEAFRKIIMRSPKDEGILIGGWVVTIDHPSNAKLDNPMDRDQAISKSSSALVNLVPFRIVWISNSVDYAYVIEEGKFDPKDPGPSKDKRPDRKGKVLVKGGYSTQAPRGMVGITYLELNSKYAGLVLE
jgi:hypothetical protein